MAEKVVSILFDADKDEICTEQPTGCTTTASFIVDCGRLAHSTDIRMDDLGVWINGGVSRAYFSVKFTSDNKVLSTEKFSSCPPVMRKSVYCLTRTYWKHKQNRLFSKQLYQLSGMYTA